MNKYKLTEETITAPGGAVLHRIQAVVDLKIADGTTVPAGARGGWIENEENLSQTGEAWVYDDARVYGKACVSGNARIYGGAEVYDDARVYGNARVDGGARVYGAAEVYGDSSVYGNADVYGNARVCGSAQVDGNATVCDNAEVRDDACIYENALVCGHAVVHENALVHWNAIVYGNAVVSGHAKVCGDAMVYGRAVVCGDARVNDTNDYAVFKNACGSGRWFTYTRSNGMWTVGCFRGTGDELIAKAYTDSELSGKCYEAIVRAQEAVDRALNAHAEKNGDMDDPK